MEREEIVKIITYIKRRIVELSYFCLLMEPHCDSLENSADRTIDWKYIGNFIQVGELTYTLPSTGEKAVYNCRIYKS